MDRKSAKLLTFTGSFLCVISVILFIINFYKKTNFLQITSFSLFVIGVISIVLSLAYYTEK